MLSRGDYEAGSWAGAVGEAWSKGREAKERKRKAGDSGQRRKEGLEMAKDLVAWLEEWKADYESVKSV